jgi:hypothetical protein
MERADAHGGLQAREQARDRKAGIAIGMAASSSPRTSAMTGTIGPFMVAICRDNMRAEASFAGGPGSAITTAAGLTVRNAVGASAHLASTIGKAPAPLSASTRPAAGCSATTISGP